MRREDSTSEVPGGLSPAAPRWYEEVPPVTAEVACEGERHRITWRRGKVVLEDHDVLAEQSLAALGGKPPVCLEVLEAWRAVRQSALLYELLVRNDTHSPELLAVMRTAHETRTQRVEARRRRVQARIGAPVVSDSMHERRRWATNLIKALPPAFKQALALSVMVNIERHWDDEGFRREHASYIEPALTAITAPLFEQSARRWRRNFKPHARIGAEACLLAPGEAPTCTAQVDARGAHAALALPISWLTDVWARGMALVDHTFVMGLAASSDDESRLRVHAVRWERQDRETSRSVTAPAHVSRGRRGELRLHWL